MLRSKLPNAPSNPARTRNSSYVRPPCFPSFTPQSLRTLSTFFSLSLVFILGIQHKQFQQESRFNRTTRLQWYPGPSRISRITRYPGSSWASRATRIQWYPGPSRTFRTWQSDTLFLRKRIQRWQKPGHLRYSGGRKN